MSLLVSSQLDSAIALVIKSLGACLLQSVDSKPQGDTKTSSTVKIALVACIFSLTNTLNKQGSSTVDGDDDATHICDGNDRQMEEFKGTLVEMWTRIESLEGEAGTKGTLKPNHIHSNCQPAPSYRDCTEDEYGRGGGL
jgi:hypothetical protein